MLAETTKVKRIATRLLVLDKDVQMRDRICHKTVADYVDLMARGVQLPPIIVFHQFGSEHYVADGWHRDLASRKLVLPTVSCEIRHGTKRDAILFAAGANASHGLRRTNLDKRWAVMALLLDEEWQKWSISQIARICHVSNGLVEEIRGRMKGPANPKKRKYKRAKDAEPRIMKLPVTEPVPLRCPRCGQPLPG